jgi:hypothetical protein
MGMDARVTSQLTSQNSERVTARTGSQLCPGPGTPENFLRPWLKLIARRVAVSIGVPYAQPENIKI